MDAEDKDWERCPYNLGGGSKTQVGHMGVWLWSGEGAPPFIRRKELVLLGDTGQAQWQGAEGVLMVGGSVSSSGISPVLWLLLIEC